MLQWLIDTVVDAVLAIIGPHNPFIDRGNTVGHDWTHLQLTQDGGYHDLDLTGIAPAGCKAVAFRVIILANAVNKTALFRTKNNAGPYNSASMRTIVANIAVDGDIIVAPNANGVIEYQFSNYGWSVIWITIKGWWL